jgi:cell wall assembly regulator SMI1
MNFESVKDRLEAFPDHEFGRGAQPEEIRGAEQLLQVRFPASYRSFLREFGWGGVEDIELFGLGGDVPPHLDLVRMTESEREEMRPRLARYLIPIMNDGGGNLYCLDASEPFREEYPVVLWDHEAGDSQQPDEIAADFSSWFSEQLDMRV